MKAISPLIATVLLIAFTMSVAAIIVSWATGFEKTQTSYVGEKGEKQIKCTYADMDIRKDNVKYNFTPGYIWVNLTMFNRGSENLYNFSFFVITDKDIYTFEPTNQKTEDSPLTPRTAILLTGNSTAGRAPTTTETFQKLKVVALCQKDYKVWHDIDMT